MRSLKLLSLLAHVQIAALYAPLGDSGVGLIRRSPCVRPTPKLVTFPMCLLAESRLKTHARSPVQRILTISCCSSRPTCTRGDV